MKLVVVTGSHRVNSESERIGRLLAARAEEQSLFEQVEILSLSSNPLPLWDEAIFSDGETWKQLLAPWRKTLKEADALIVVSPEWNGMVPAGLKNFFLIFGAAQLGHKPALIVAVSSGQGGSYPVAELRMSSYKNSRLCFLPEHLIIHHADTALIGQDGEADEYLLSRTDYCLKLLREYGVGLSHVRSSGVIDHQTFRNGM
ncbi:flavoprotein [Endozoicomonas sp. (ex Bugula neritina AB1)]|nr:flavoprotein [Endozoicomonas sp. (ex Bugula neritina AB1)]